MIKYSQAAFPGQLFVVKPLRSAYTSSALTLFHPSITPSLKFGNRFTLIAPPPLWNKFPPELQQLIHPTNSPKPHLVLPLHRSFIQPEPIPIPQILS